MAADHPPKPRSARPADRGIPALRRWPGIPAVSRRRFLAGTSALALAPALPLTFDAAAPAAAPAGDDRSWRGEPFDDGTYFDDGYGWVD